MVTDNIETIIDKVTKLIEKAENTPYEEEADSFRAKAYELMIRNAIDESMIAARRGRGDDKIIEKRFTYTGQFASANAHICLCVAEGFGFKVLKYGDPYKPSTEHPAWVGFESDVRVAEVVLSSLLIQSSRELARFTSDLQTRHPYYSTRQLYKPRRSFIYAFGTRVCERLKEVKQVVTAEVDAESDGGASLAVIERDRQIELWFDEQHADIRKGRASRMSHSAIGARAGWNAGANADIGSPQVGGQKALEQ